MSGIRSTVPVGVTARVRRAVLFDLDGTLVATKRLYLECYRRALARPLGRELSDEELLALNPRAEARLLRDQVDGGAVDACLSEFYRHYEALHDELFEGIYDGVPEMLAALRGAGATLGIVTGKSRRAWEITARRAPLGEFEIVVVDDEVEAPKPDPGGIRLALASLATGAQRSAYVGDSMGDVQAAAAAGVRPIAALWAKPPAQRDSFARRARAEGADIARTPAEVTALILG